MNQAFRISGSLQLRIDDKNINVNSRDGSILISLPKNSFIHAAINSYTNPLANNHYHHVAQSTECAFGTPVIDSIMEKPEGVILQGSLSSGNDTAKYRLEFSEDKDGLLLTASLAHDRINRIYLDLGSPADERFYGFGEQFTYVEFSGKRFP
jgi:hypothetical protein